MPKTKKLILLCIILFSCQLAACLNEQLLQAAQDGEIEKVKALLNENADVNTQNAPGHTPLIIAARYGHQQIVQELLAAGANVNAQDYNCWTALIWATFEDNTEVVQALINANADVNVNITNDGSALNQAVDRESIEIVQLLLQANAEVNAKLDGDWTVLMSAASSGKAEIVQALINAGADLNAKNENGETALALAIEDSNLQVVKALVNAKADLDAKNTIGRTALLEAIRNNNTEIVTLLIEKKANVHLKDDDERTTLMYAVDRQLERDLILDVMQQNHLRDIPAPSMVIVLQLLQANVDVNAIDNKDRIALDYALMYRNDDLINALLKAGANITPKVIRQANVNNFGYDWFCRLLGLEQWITENRWDLIEIPLLADLIITYCSRPKCLSAILKLLYSKKFSDVQAKKLFDNALVGNKDAILVALIASDYFSLQEMLKIPEVAALFAASGLFDKIKTLYSLKQTKEKEAEVTWGLMPDELVCYFLQSLFLEIVAFE